MKKGTVLLFNHKSGPKAALAVDLVGKTSWKLVDERGQSYVANEKDILWELPNYSLVASQLGDFLAEASLAASKVDLATAWELLQDKRVASWEDIADLAGGGVGPAEVWALARALEADRFYFKPKSGGYEVRTPAHVADLKLALEAEHARLVSWEGFLARFTESSKSRSGIFLPEDRPRYEALVDFALWGDESRLKSLASKVLDALGRKVVPESALAALLEAAWWPSHVQLGVLRRGYDAGFTRELVAELEGLVAVPPPDSVAGVRKDFLDVSIFTIDAASTCEVDDGVSLHSDSSGAVWLGVHIADPGRWVLPGSLVDSEALRRATTVYVPGESFPMLPLELSAGPASLNVGSVVPSLSFFALLGEDGSLARWRICASLVKPTRRLDYEEASGFIEAGSHDLAVLHGLALRHLRWRESCGALTLVSLEADIDLSSGVPKVGLVAENAARLLVSECMILAGEIAGRFAREQGLLLPFRAQDKPRFDELALAAIPEGLARDFARRRSMSKSKTALEPKPHASLGLPCYVQVTSPLRRYNDLVAQRVIKAALVAGVVAEGLGDLGVGAEGGALTPEVDLTGALTPGVAFGLGLEDWEAILARTLPAMQEASRAEAECKRYWILEYMRLGLLEGRAAYEVVVLGAAFNDDSSVVVVFLDSGLEWTWKPPRSCKPGEKLGLTLVSIDPRLERVVLRLN